MTIEAWFLKNVKGWHLDRVHPVTVDVDGVPVPVDQWATLVIEPGSDVRIYPIPYGPAVPVWMVWTAVIVAVASAAYSIYMMSQMDTGAGSMPGNGDQLNLSPAKANSAKLGAPIREVFGSYRVFPDYVVQPVSRFVDEKNYCSSMFLSIGVGNFSIPPSRIGIGATPVTSFGDDVSYTIYPPGADVSADPRSENWFSSTEVGNTSGGTAGIDLGATGPATVSISADAVQVAGNTLTLIGDDAGMPASWEEGSIVTIEAPASWVVEARDGYSVIYGDLSELAPAPGMPVTLNWSNTDYDLVVASYTQEVPAVPGVGGNAASITASASPVSYDFTLAPVTFDLSWRGTHYIVSLVTDYVTMSGLVETITAQLTGSRLVAQDVSGRVVITEQSSPYQGGSIDSTNLPVSVFGDEPASISGTASSGGSAGARASIHLAWESGDRFAGLPGGVQRMSVGLAGNRYQITEIDGVTISLVRVSLSEDVNGNIITTPDLTWPGFTPRTLLDASVSGVNDDYDWSGPFLVCPDGETTNRIEVNLNFQNGLVKYDSKGKKKSKSVTLLVQYRNVEAGGNWTEKTLTYSRNTEDQIGFTEAFSVPTGQYEIRMRRKDPVSGSSTRDQVYWQALRARLQARPTRYHGITTIAITVRTGNRLAAQSDRRINLVATRLYDNGGSRTISGALYHVLDSLGMPADRAIIDALEEIYWTPRGETFDYVAGESNTSALNVLKLITTAGMGYFLLSDGLASAGREGVKNWTGIISPQEMTEPMQVAFSAPSPDDYDAVDVTYVNGTTWTEETVQCRSSDVPTPVKIESYKAEGVLDASRAWRLGMRRLMKYKHQRLTHAVATEMDALCYNYGDRLVLTNDIPGSMTTSCLITEMSYTSSLVTMTVSEPLDWNIPQPRCLIRFQDGSASMLLTPTRIDTFTLSVPNTDAVHPDDWIMDEPTIEPPRLIFCSSHRVGFDSTVAEITPASDGTCQLNGVEYNPIYYQYDDALYPGDTV